MPSNGSEDKMPYAVLEKQVKRLYAGNPHVRFDMEKIVRQRLSAGCFLVLGLLCCGTCAFADDLTVSRGETVVLSENAAYETVTVSGTLNISSGVTLTVGTLELGPNAGDTAVVNVLGSAGTGLNITNAVNVGSSGGSGQIVALSPDATHNTGWDSVCVLKLKQVNISINAAASASGFIDFLKIGPGTADFVTMSNASSTRARILVKNGCVGYAQNWGKTMFVGPFQVESFDGGNIRFGNHYGLRSLNSDSLVVKGNGKDVYFCRYVDDANQCFVLKSGVSWDSVRDVILVEKHSVATMADDLLPYGPSAGVVWLTHASLQVLNIGSTVQHLNSFSSASGTNEVSLTGNAGSKVIFGEGDTDGFLKGCIHDNVGVFKVGTGTFSITNEAKVGAMTVSNGTLRVASGFSVGELTIAAGATLEIDGVTVVPSSGKSTVYGNVVLKNGGRLVSSITVTEDMRLQEYANACEWTKDGAGTLIVEPICMPSNVHVKAGTLAFTAAGFACELFKWNVTEWNNAGWYDKANGATSNMFYLGEFAFVSTNGMRIGGGAITTAPIGTAPGELASGEASFAAGTTLMGAGGRGDAGNLFDADGNWPRVGVVSPLITDEGGVTLYVRLPAGSGPVAAINFAGAYGGLPKAWTLSGSTDGGETWHTLNQTTNYSVTDYAAQQWIGSSSGGVGSVVPKAFPLDDPDLIWTRPGVLNMPDSMRIEVNDGAVLDFTNVTGGQTVDAVTVDAAAGGGTIRNAKFAQAGTIFVNGISQGANIGNFSVSLILENAQDFANLGAWRICVNGTMLPAGKYRVSYSSGRLSVSPRGFAVILK